MPGFSYRLFEQEGADALIARAKRPELDLSEKFVRDALGKGDACHAILRNDEIVAYVWSAFSPTHDSDGVYVSVGTNHRYAYKAFTLREYRGHHFHRLFKPFRESYAIARGCTETSAFIEVANQPSIRSTIAQGYRRIGFAAYLKYGPVFVAYCTRGARQHGFRFVMRRQENVL